MVGILTLLASRPGPRNDPKRDAHAAATRAAILEKARELFVAHGYETMTIRQIAKAAGKSTGALFAHWDSKDALFTEAMGRPPFTDRAGFVLWSALQTAGVPKDMAMRLAMEEIPLHTLLQWAPMQVVLK